MAIKFNSKKHEVFDFLTFEYGPLDKDYLRGEFHFSGEEIITLERGLNMEIQGWGFLEFQNCIVFGARKKEILDRNYLIVTPDRQIIPTHYIGHKRLIFGDMSSILCADAGNYFGICKQFLGEIAFERAGSF